MHYDDLQVGQLIQKQLNLVELSNKLFKVVFFHKQSEFVYQDTKEEQEVDVLCKQLIQNIIIY